MAAKISATNITIFIWGCGHINDNDLNLDHPKAFPQYVAQSGYMQYAAFALCQL